MTSAKSPASDHEAIRNMFARYCQAIDDRRADDVTRLFAVDGLWATPGATYRGRDEIRAYARSLVPQSPESQVKHITVNPVIEVDGGTATAVSDFIVVQKRPGGGVVYRGGRYHDRLIKQDGTWLLAERRHESSAWADD